MDALDGLQRLLTQLFVAPLGRQEAVSRGHTTCLLVLTSVATVWFLLKLANVLVPLTFAIFLAFLVEPVLSAFVLLPSRLLNGCRRARNKCRKGRRRRREGCPVAADGTPSSGRTSSEEASEEGSRGAAEDSGGPTDLEGGGREHHEGEQPAKGSALQGWLTGAWDLVAIVLCTSVIVLAIYGVVMAIIQAFVNFDWRVYEHSPRIAEFRDLLSKLGINIEDIVDGSILSRYRGEVVSVALEVMDVLKSVVLTLLLFFFVLVAILPGIHTETPRSPVRRLMQRYLLMKTIASLIIALAVMLGLWLLRVELVPVFGIVTFALNFIPNIGSFFAVIAPVPLVLLDPSRSLLDAAMVVIVPFLIHNTLGTILEPKLMASGLDLHPLTVVVALTFWGSLWGIAGAVLSVPITCGCRVYLMEVDHPYAKMLQDLLEQPMQSGLRPSSADSVAGKSAAGSAV